MSVLRTFLMDAKEENGLGTAVGLVESPNVNSQTYISAAVSYVPVCVYSQEANNLQKHSLTPMSESCCLPACVSAHLWVGSCYCNGFAVVYSHSATASNCEFRSALEAVFYENYYSCLGQHLVTDSLPSHSFRFPV